MSRLKGFTITATAILWVSGCASTNPWLTGDVAEVADASFDRSGFGRSDERGYSVPTTQSEFMPMSVGLRNHYRLREEEMKGLQYYLSDTIILRKVDRSGTRKVDYGRLIEDAGDLVDEVVVEAGTPGVARHLPGGAIEVAFEEGATLTFSPAYSSDLYHLQGTYDYWGDERAYVVEYRGGYYRALGESRHSHLLIDRQFRYEAEDQSRYLPGRRLTGVNFSGQGGYSRNWNNDEAIANQPVNESWSQGPRSSAPPNRSNTHWRDTPSQGTSSRPSGMRADPANNPYLQRLREQGPPVRSEPRKETVEYPGLPRHQDIYSQY